MSPLDLPGPSFLVFYALFALVVLSVLYVAHSSAEAGAAPRLDASDPYLIAYLRGGPFEAMRVATVSLIDRGLLVVDDKTSWVKRRVRVQNLRSPIEQALTDFFSNDRPANEIFDGVANVDLRQACADYEQRLTALDLLPGLERRRLLDDHRHDVPEPVFELLTVLAARAPNALTVILERDGDYPPIARLLAEVERARASLARGRESMAA